MYLCLDEIDVEYYSTMAERRRVALAEALEENEQLHQEIDNMRLELDSLKAENTMLKPLAEEAEYLAGVLKVSNHLNQAFLPKPMLTDILNFPTPRN